MERGAEKHLGESECWADIMTLKDKGLSDMTKAEQEAIETLLISSIEVALWKRKSWGVSSAYVYLSENSYFISSDVDHVGVIEKYVSTIYMRIPVDPETQRGEWKRALYRNPFHESNMKEAVKRGILEASILDEEVIESEGEASNELGSQ